MTALAKGLTVLAAFVPGHGEMTLGELTEATGLNKSTVQRSAFTLEALGYLVKDPNSRRFRLTPKSLELGGGYLRLGELIERANPYLHELNRNTGESCNLLEPCGSDMVYVARFAKPQGNLDPCSAGPAPADVLHRGRAGLSVGLAPGRGAGICWNGLTGWR